MVDSIKITALQDIGANIAYTTIAPVVNMAGTPITQKATLQNIGNLILGGAGGSYFPRAAQANLALSVANAAQPNITSVGTLTSLSVTGNVTAGNINGGNLIVANFFSGDGGFLTNVNANGSNYSNSNVANYLPTYTGNIGANTISSSANITIETDGGNTAWVFGEDGALYWPGPYEWAIEPNGNEFEIHSHSNVIISTDTSNSNLHFTFDTDGYLSFPNNNLNISGDANVVGSETAVIQTTPNVPLVLITEGYDSSLNTIWLEDISDSANSNVAAVYINPSAKKRGVRVVTGNNASNTHIWDFESSGNLVLPGNTVSINFANGVTAFGNVVSVNLDGNSSNVLHGDGTWSADATDYGNSNVANYLPTYNGTIGANLVTSDSNLQITTDYGNANISFIFGSGGALYWPAPGLETWAIEPNGNLEFEIKSTTNVVISTDTSNVNSHFTFDSDGIFTAPSNVNLLGTRLNVGSESANLTGLNAPTLVIATESNTFVQAALTNTDGNGSADFATYGTGGNDTGGWSDLGYAGFDFSDPAYTITAPGDGYVFVQAYANGLGGNMVLATGDTGNSADIIFATGGFLSSDEFARIDHANSLLHLTRANSAIKFNDGTTQNSAAIVWTTAPVSNTSPGIAGQAAYDTGGNLYVCVSTNTWSKFTGTTSW